MNIKNILEKTKTDNNISHSDIVELLNSDGELLFKYADECRRQYVGDDVHLRGLIEFSNICKNPCKYCGLRNENHKISRYRLSEDEIIDFASRGVEYGYKTIVLQSGEDKYFTQERMCKIISRIKEMDVALTLSLGEKSYDEYKAYKEAGADRYLIRIETTDKTLYEKMHPGMNFENRLKCLQNLQEIGFETGSGCLVGLPEQTIDSLANDILYFKNSDFDMIGVGPFIPHPETPLWKDESNEIKNKRFELSLKVMAVIRLLLRNINIPATTAMETINPNGRIIALQSGANVVMPNITEGEYRKQYEIYPNKICVNESPSMCRNCISAKIKSIGRNISQSKGFRCKI